jgi:two-component system sensor histidine kinase YesM
MIVLISLIIAAVISAIGSFSYYTSMKAIDSDVVRFSNQILTQANFNLSRYIDDNERFFERVGHSSEFRDWSMVNQGEDYPVYKNYRLLETNLIEPFILYHPEMLSIVFYSSNGHESIYRNPLTQNYVLNWGYSMKNQDWFQALPFSGQVTRLVALSSHYADQSGTAIPNPVLTYVQKYSFGTNTGYLQFDISLESTQAILDAIQLGANGSTFIVDGGGRIVSSPDYSQIGTQAQELLEPVLRSSRSGSYYLEETKQMVVYQTVPSTGWRIVSIIPYSDLAGSIRSIRSWTTLMTLVGIILASLLVSLVAASITKRLKELRKTIGKTRMGRLDIRVAVKGSDEVAELGAAYNLLLDRIDVSITQLAESRIVQQQAILSALQAQINSHFLFNALESINSMANLARHKGIQDTTLALSNMLRYTSNYQHALVRLEDEMQHLHDYIHIMRILYRDDVQFHVEQDETLRECRCLKAIVQPFVENSIKHGYETTAEPMMISITAKRDADAYVCIEIADNGRGIDPDKLKELQVALGLERPAQEFMQLSRIGVLNVHYRLKTFYKDLHSGVSISCSAAGETRILIKFPYYTKDVISL